MRSDGPILLALPAFRGLTRKLILLALVVAAALLVLRLVMPGFAGLLIGLFALSPNEALRLIWQLATWPFIPENLLGLFFALLSLWYFGSALEEERGERWFGELFFFSAIGGAFLATILSVALGRFLAIFSATGQSSSGLWPVVLALLVAYARLHAEETLTFDFFFRARAKYIAAIFLLVYIFFDLYAGRRFDALVTLCATLFAWIFQLIAPRKGLRHASAERWYGLRNSYYRSKRRRAAKKFQVYMRKQGKEVNIDENGRYLGLDDEDPTDRRHMN